MFGGREVVYLGNIFRENEVKPIPSRVDAIKNISLPKDRKELRSFLGAVNQFQEFIPNYRVMIHELDKMTSKNAKFEWTEGTLKAFEDAKNSLSSDAVLTMYSPEAEHIVETDASDHAFGSCLKQVEISPQGTRMEKVVEYYSKAFNPAQRNYFTTEKEFLALYASLKKWRSYLIFEKFLVRTDNHATCWISRIAKTKETIPENQRLLRWSLALQDYNFDIVHVSGVKHQLADCLSRNVFPKIDLKLLIDQEEKLKKEKEFGWLMALTRGAKKLMEEKDAPEFVPTDEYLDPFTTMVTDFHDSFEELKGLSKSGSLHPEANSTYFGRHSVEDDEISSSP